MKACNSIHVAHALFVGTHSNNRSDPASMTAHAIKLAVPAAPENSVSYSVPYLLAIVDKAPEAAVSHIYRALDLLSGCS